MKKTYLVLIMMILNSIALLSQVPYKMNYQTVIRDVDGTMVRNKTVGMKIHIQKGTSKVYTERHQPVSNDNGLVTVVIGSGSVEFGSLESIDWTQGSFTVLSETDPNGGFNYSLTGTQEILSVPYAFYAANDKAGAKGPKGDTGDTGPKGTMGDRGDAGMVGPAGPQGIKGTSGDVGPVGPRGQKGDPGDHGSSGPQGLKGLTGDAGPAGVKGPKGDVGNTGPSGPQGLQGLKGTKGDKGDTGNPGPQGADGTSHFTKSGNDIYYTVGNVGIGTNTPDATLTVSGDLKILDFTGSEVATLSDLGFMRINGQNGQPNFVLTSTTVTPDLPFFSLHDDLGNSRYDYGIASDKYGFASFLGPNGNENIHISALSDNFDRGYLAIADESGYHQSVIDITPERAGRLFLYGQNGFLNVLFTNLVNYPNSGWMGIQNSSGNTVFRAYSNGSNENGVIIVSGNNGSRNVLLSNISSYPNNGFAGVFDANNSQKSGMYVNTSGQGEIFANVKNFKMDHPTEPESSIWYASIEGPEAAAYERGTAVLSNGEVFIPYTEHYQMVANTKSVTILLTPHSAETYGIGVVEKLKNGFRVKELKNGKGNFSFDWEVKAVRKGFEDYEVIRANEDLTPTSGSETDGAW